MYKRDYKKEYEKYQSSPKAIKPLSKGGSNSKSNLRVVSRKTNRQKGDKY